MQPSARQTLFRLDLCPGLLLTCKRINSTDAPDPMRGLRIGRRRGHLCGTLHLGCLTLCSTWPCVFTSDSLFLHLSEADTGDRRRRGLSSGSPSCPLLWSSGSSQTCGGIFWTHLPFLLVPHMSFGTQGHQGGYGSQAAPIRASVMFPVPSFGFAEEAAISNHYKICAEGLLETRSSAQRRFRAHEASRCLPGH
jgi:hypothetical protein